MSASTRLCARVASASHYQYRGIATCRHQQQARLREASRSATCARTSRARKIRGHSFSTSCPTASAKPPSTPGGSAPPEGKPVISLEESGLSSPNAKTEGETRDFRPPWFYRFTRLSMFAAIPGIALYSMFFYNWGDTEHVFSEPQRWKARLLGEPEPQFKKAVLTRTLPRPAFTGAEDDANRAALLAAADEQVRAEIEAAHKEALAAIEGTETPAAK